MAEMDNLELKNNGKDLNVLGVNINIAEILGEKIAKEWIGSLDESHMESIIKYLSDEYFTIDKYTDEVKIKHATRDWDSKKYPIDTVKSYFSSATKDLLLEKVKEIINSTEYKETIDKMAEELVDYAIEGYKEDLKKELRTRLVDNVLAPTPSYGDIDLYTIINSLIDARLR